MPVAGAGPSPSAAGTVGSSCGDGRESADAAKICERDVTGRDRAHNSVGLQKSGAENRGVLLVPDPEFADAILDAKKQVSAVIGVDLRVLAFECSSALQSSLT